MDTKNHGFFQRLSVRPRINFAFPTNSDRRCCTPRLTWKYKLLIIMVAWPALLLTAPAILNSLAPLADPLRAAANKIPGFSGKKTGDPAMQPDISSIHWSKMTFKTVAGPVITQNFPDPSIIEVNGTYYAFATNNKGEKDSMIHIQVATSTDFKKWAVTGEDALPTVGAWSVGHRVWAPDVVQLVSSLLLPLEVCHILPKSMY